MTSKKKWYLDGECSVKDKPFVADFVQEIQKYLLTHSIDGNEAHFRNDIRSFILPCYVVYEKKITHHYAQLKTPKGRMHRQQIQSYLLDKCQSFLNFSLSEWINYKKQISTPDREELALFSEMVYRSISTYISAEIDKKNEVFFTTLLTSLKGLN